MTNFIDVMVGPGHMRRVALGTEAHAAAEAEHKAFLRSLKPRVPLGCKPCHNRRFIAHGQGNAGLGDALLGLCAVYGYAKANPDIGVTYGAAHHTVRFSQLFEAPYAFDYGWGRPAGPGDLRISDAWDPRIVTEPCFTRLRAYCLNFGDPLPVLPKLKQDLSALAAGYEGAVVLAPSVALPQYRSRQYPAHAWLELADRLRAAGERVLIADNVAARLQLFQGFEWVQGPAEGWPPERLAGLMQVAACLVGNDSGLAHLAGIVGCPTVALCGATVGDRIFSFYPRVESIQGSLACDGCWWHGKYRAELCDVGCASIAGIPTESVLAAVKRAKARKAASLRVATHCTREYAELHALTWPSKLKYAQSRGLDWFASIDRTDLTWQLWLDQLQLMREGGWLWALDADAAITGEQDVRELCVGDVVLGRDWNGLNCGSMLLRNTASVKAMIVEAIALRSTSRWQEQGLVEQLAPKHGVDLRVVERRLLNSYGFADWQPGDLVCHMPGQPMAERLEKLRAAVHSR